MDDKLGGKAVQVRVTQGKEPAHFRQLFKGKMIVHSGGKASAYKNISAADSLNTSGTALFRVHGTNPLNTCAVEVAPVTSSLNSEDTFVLVTPSDVTVWQGRGTNDLEKATGANIANILANGYE